MTGRAPTKMMPTTHLVDRYVDAAISHLRRLDSMRCPDPHMPAEMRDPSLDEDDWLGWEGTKGRNKGVRNQFLNGS